MQDRRQNKGFTLIEIMVVVVIIGLLSTLVGPRIWSMLFAGKTKIAKTKCKELWDDCHVWKLNKRAYPSTLEEMEAPLTKGDENNFINLTDDPWGSPYFLETEGRKIIVWSPGPDGQQGTEDDISYPEADDG